nr:unnamed protein product [Callosobruchus analis]
MTNDCETNRLTLPEASQEAQKSVSWSRKLRNRLKAIIQPGVSKTWMDLLRIKAVTFDDFQRPCVLYIDEVRLKPNIYYNISSDKIIGVLPDAIPGNVVPVRYATLLMVQGLCGEWQQPIAYTLSTCKCTASKLKRTLTECVETLTGMNLKVMALMCPADPNCVQMAQQLAVSVDRPYFYLAAQKIHFLFDVQRLSQHLWNCFLTVSMRLNDTIISGRYLKVRAKLEPSAFPSKNAKLRKVSRNYRHRIFTEEIPRGFYYVQDKKDQRRSVQTFKFLSTIASFSVLMLDKKEPFRGTADERDPIDACHLLLNKLQPVSRHSGTSLCIKRWKVTVKSIANLWEDVRSLGFQHMFVPNMRCFQRFSRRNSAKNGKNGFFDMQMTPNQFLQTFRDCFAAELLDNKSTTNEMCTKLLEWTSLVVEKNEPATNADGLNGEDTDYRRVQFPLGQCPSPVPLYEYLLSKCLKQHTCPLCLNYVEVQKTHFRDCSSAVSAIALEALYKPHRSFASFVTGMDAVFRHTFKSVIVHSCAVKNLTNLLRKLSLVHPCLNFPFKYVTKLFARLRLYHTLKYLNHQMKCCGEAFIIDDLWYSSLQIYFFLCTMDLIKATDSQLLLERLGTDDCFDAISQQSDCSATDSCSSAAYLYGGECMDYSNEGNSVIEIDNDEDKKSIDAKMVTPIMCDYYKLSHKGQRNTVSVQTLSKLCSNSSYLVALQQEIDLAQRQKKALTRRLERTLSKRSKLMADRIKLQDYKKLTKKYFHNRGVSDFIINLLDSSESSINRRFSPAFKRTCLNLFLTASPFYERKLIEGFPLPRSQTLRDYAEATMQAADGCLDHFELLRMKADGMTDSQRACVLRMFQVQDEATGQLKHAQLSTVFMLHGFASNWLQLISYHFSESPLSFDQLANLLEETISRLHSTKLNVVALICDANKNTKQMAELLNVSAECNYLTLQNRPPIPFMFEAQQLSVQLWDVFAKTDLLLNGCLVSLRTHKKLAGLLPTRHEKLTRLFGRKCYKRILRKKTVRVFSECAKKEETRATLRFFDILKDFEELAYEPEKVALNTLKLCYDHFEKLDTIDRNIDFETCKRNILVTLRSVMTLWTEVGMDRGFISVRSLIDFVGYNRSAKKKISSELSLMTPLLFNEAFKHFFVSELMNVSFIKNDASLNEINNILCKSSGKCPMRDSGLFKEAQLIETDYRTDGGLKRDFPRHICMYLLRKCLSVHGCSKCETYVSLQSVRPESERAQLADVFSRQNAATEETIDLKAVHRDFVGFVKSMEVIFRKKLDNFATFKNGAVAQLTKSFRCLKLEHPCLRFPFQYVTLLFARVRLYHELRRLDEGKYKKL